MACSSLSLNLSQPPSISLYLSLSTGTNKIRVRISINPFLLFLCKSKERKGFLGFLSLGFRRPFSLRQDRYEFPNFQEESAVSEQNPSSDTASVASTDSIEFQGQKKQISREVNRILLPLLPSRHGL